MKLLARLGERLRVLHYSFRTERGYVAWAERYLRFHRSRTGRWMHTQALGEPGIAAFLGHLATERKVSASTQNQALNALVFLHKQVLGMELGRFEAQRGQRPERVPVVLSRDECGRLIAAMASTTRGTASASYTLMVKLMCGCGLRRWSVAGCGSRTST